MTNAISTTQELTFENALERFLRTLRARNLSLNTIIAYRTDVDQFITWLHDTDVSVIRPDQVTRNTITEYLLPCPLGVTLAFLVLVSL